MVHKSPTDYDRRNNQKAIEEEMAEEEDMGNIDSKIEDRLALVEAALQDYHKGSLSAFSAYMVVGMIINPGEIGEKEKEWARGVLAHLEKEEGSCHE